MPSSRYPRCSLWGRCSCKVVTAAALIHAVSFIGGATSAQEPSTALPSCIWGFIAPGAAEDGRRFAMGLRGISPHCVIAAIGGLLQRRRSHGRTGRQRLVMLLRIAPETNVLMVCRSLVSSRTGIAGNHAGGGHVRRRSHRTPSVASSTICFCLRTAGRTFPTGVKPSFTKLQIFHIDR